MDDYKSEKFKAAVQRHLFESEQQVSRNNFYMIFQGVVIAGFFQFIGSSGFSDKLDNNYFYYSYLFLISLMILLSYLQFNTACGSVKLIMTSNHRLRFIEQDIDSNEDCKINSVYYSNKGDRASEWMDATKKSMINDENGCTKNMFNSLILESIKGAPRVSFNAINVSIAFILFWMINLVLIFCAKIN
ncbi:hypothetical protein [Comamonas testosteroni]|uniref:RipA family octameric membrane protein n=1 Tax=Comamonas testosteroni TaxID=285 RepID=UPI0026F1A35C|nr:hypothetical protein [Comamonas testosteroni]